MLHIVMDSAGDVPPEWLEQFQIHIIPVNIHFGEETYLDGVTLDKDGFYRMVEERGIIPKTSQPSPHQFVSFYRQIANPGDTVLSIHVTSRLSGTYASAEIAARDLEGEIDVVPFDSGCGSAGMGFMCMEARLLERAGATIENILARLREIRERMQIILTLDTLDFARMSGRVKTLQAALVSLLNIKPVIELQNGMLEMADKVRTRSRALKHVIARIQECFGDVPLNVAVVHAADITSGKKLLAQVRNHLHCKRLILTDLSIAVAANLGPGTVGIVAYPAGKV
ncbi:MAG: DegV family protein [Anaerolineae bacterium]|nr:MAG: DegV family protein [Anaerolineae bacterium]